jgi:DNA-binding NarL/FixJ family response regulator
LDFVEAALSGSALGHILNACIARDLIAAIHQALEGKTFVSPSLRLH